MSLSTSQPTTYGPVKHLITDGHASFTGRDFNEWCRINSVTHHVTTRYNPRSNGMIERTHAALRRTLGILSGPDKAAWLPQLKRAQWCLNVAFNRSTSITPYQFMFARLPPTLTSVIPDVLARSNALDIADSMRVIANMHALWSAEASKRMYDASATATSLEVGESVLMRVFAPDSRQHPLWCGPYVVTAVEPDRADYYVIASHTADGAVAGTFTCPVDHLRRYDASRPDQPRDSPLKRGEHVPAAIIGDRRSGPKRQLHIKWHGLPDDINTSWENVAGAHANRSLLRHPLVTAHLASAPAQ